MTLEFAGEELRLLKEKVIFWPRTKTLILSDLHLGKAESLQSFGIPIPIGSDVEDLERLKVLINEHDVQTVAILGDLIHQKNSWTNDLFLSLKKFFDPKKNIKFQIVLGNHERGSLPFLRELDVDLIDDFLAMGPVILSHGHKKPKGEYEISGHIHPVIQLKHGSVKLRLPCFVVKPHAITLPSYGSLTGGFKIEQTRDKKIFAISQAEVFEVGFS